MILWTEAAFLWSCEDLPVSHFDVYFSYSYVCENMGPSISSVLTWAKQSSTSDRADYVSRDQCGLFGLDKWTCQRAARNRVSCLRHAESRGLLCLLFFWLSCVECCNCVRTSPCASVYLTSPRFKLVVATTLSYEFSLVLLPGYVWLYRLHM